MYEDPKVNELDDFLLAYQLIGHGVAYQWSRNEKKMLGGLPGAIWYA
jgi:hypothetical protein